MLWISSGPTALLLLCWLGLAASVLLTLNRWPRMMIALAGVLFLSFVVVARDFSGYQSDGMLLAAALISWFLAPPGRRPGLGRSRPPTPLSLFLLQWLWFRIYFESGLAKMLSGDPHWRHFTALDGYYQNCPLPTWLGWFLGHLPHGFNAVMTAATLALELGLCWLVFAPRRGRIAAFLLTTPFQIVVGLTANYAFINWIEGGLGVLLLDDRFLAALRARLAARRAAEIPAMPARPLTEPSLRPAVASPRRLRIWCEGLFLGWIFYATLARLLWMPWPQLPLPRAPVTALAPLRVANQYGLFAVMTPARYEIEFQGSEDGQHWRAYPYRFKPQALSQAPGLYAPYQPRFDWNLWFASLGDWRQYPWVVRCEESLLTNDPAVTGLFAANPFSAAPPRYLRAVRWRYWFTDWSAWRRTGAWWRRQDLGLYAPELERLPNGRLAIAAWPAPGY